MAGYGFAELSFGFLLLPSEGVVKAWIGFLGKTKKCRVRRMGATHQIKARRHITTVTKPD